MFHTANILKNWETKKFSVLKFVNTLNFLVS